MINRIRRACERLHWTRNERKWRAEVDRLMTAKETWAEDMDKALRNVSACAINRTMIDIHRPAVSSAPGRHRNDGQRRFSLVEPPA